jgi:hypothetical protein
LAPFYVNEGSFPPVDGAPVLLVVKQTALDDGCGPALLQGVGNGPRNAGRELFARVAWVLAGAGSDFSEASMSGFESTALELVVAPECPPVSWTAEPATKVWRATP